MNDRLGEQERVPCFTFRNEDYACGSDTFWAWRDACSVLFDVAVNSPQAAAAFEGSIVSFHLGQMVVGLMRSSSQTQRRSNTTIARSGIDHILVRHIRAGSCEGDADGHVFHVHAGQAVILDLARPLSMQCHNVECSVLVLPRAMFTGRCEIFDESHGMVLAGPLAQVLVRHLQSLLDEAPGFVVADGLALTDPTVALVAACMRELAGRRPEGRAVTLMAVKRYLDEHLSDPELRAEAVCHRFGLSRPTLYRLFEPYGGVARYLQDRRLKRCFNDLVSSTANPRRIADIADAWGFQSAAVFSRAFRRMYGVSPRDARLAGTRGFHEGEDGRENMVGWVRSLKRL